MEHLNKLTRDFDDGIAPLMIDTTQFDCTNLPLSDGSVDVVVTDLPFGKRISEGMLGNFISASSLVTIFPRCQ